MSQKAPKISESPLGSDLLFSHNVDEMKSSVLSQQLHKVHSFRNSLWSPDTLSMTDTTLQIITIINNIFLLTLCALAFYCFNSLIKMLASSKKMSRLFF